MRRNVIALAVFVLVCAGLFLGLAGQLGVFSGNTSRYTVRLKDAGGLVVGNSVRIAGVEVGRVQSIRLEDNRAVLEIAIDRAVQLYAADCAKPRPKSLLGEKYLHLDQGTSAAGDPIAPGAEILCTREMVDVGDALEGLAPILQSEEDVYPLVVKLLKRLDGLTSTFDTEAPGDASDPADGGEGSDSGRTQAVGEVVSNLGGLIDESRGAAAAGRAILEENRADLREIVLASKRNLSDPRLSRAIGNLEAISRDGKKTLARLDRIAEKTERIVDTLDRNLSDQRFADLDDMLGDGKIAVHNLREASAALTGLGASTTTLVDSLVVLAKRAESLTEKQIRTFLQQEGMRVRVIPDRDVRQRIRELEREGD
jgi:ABC-type transporter Mla subunit MlaD